MSIVARRALSVVFAILSMVGVGVLDGASASAEIIHKFEFNFDGSTTPNGSFKGWQGAAIDQASGDVYIENREEGVVYEFDASGKYLAEITGGVVPQGFLGLAFCTTGVAVDNSTGADKGDVYVAGTDNGVVYKFDSTGKLISELTGSNTLSGSFTPVGVAVDASGDLYVLDATNDVVDEFDASGNLISELRSPEIVNPYGIAVDSSGNVYVDIEAVTKNIVELEPDGSSTVLDVKSPEPVVVDPVTERVYVFEDDYPSSERIVELDQSGNRLGTFGEGLLSAEVTGIAVNSATGEIYAVDNQKKLVDVFGPAVVIPDTVTQAASNVLPAGVTLNATVNPDGLQVSGCQFEYGTSSSYGQIVACEQTSASIGSGTAPVPVSAAISGLQPDTEYHFRVSASNANGTNQSADATFTTSGPPRIDGESSTNVARATVELRGQVDPFGLDTTYRFEYGTSTSYGASVPVPDADIGSGMGEVEVGQQLSGLAPGVTYHYRLVATNSQGTVDGPDQEVTTVAPADIDAEYVTEVASQSATFNAEVNPLGANTEYRLEYGRSTVYGHVLTGDVGEGTADVLVSRHLQEFEAGTTYHYRFVVHNEFGTVEGVDHTFTTQASGGQELSLPDGRAWELVSPADKKGALIGAYSPESPFQAAADGNAIAYPVSEPIGESVEGRNESAMILSKRGEDGWSSQDISPPNSLAEGRGSKGAARSGESIRVFSADLSFGLIEPPAELDGAPPLSPEATERTLYLHDQASGSYLPLETPTNVLPGTKFRDPTMEFLVGTPDLSHVVFASSIALTPEAVGYPVPPEGVEEGPAYESSTHRNLYEWSDGKLQLVNIKPDGTTEPDSWLGSTEVQLGVVANTVSSDGRWVVWSDNRLLTQSLEAKSVSLYIRDMVAGKTFQIGGGYPRFETMSKDGSKVFFVEADSTEAGYGGDLYVFDTATGKQIDLTPEHGLGEASAGVQNAVMGASEDGSYVYFVATGVLASGAVRGADNVYVLHESEGIWTTRYIATLAGQDAKSWRGKGSNGEFTSAVETGPVDPQYVSSRVSPNGRYLAFMSERSLTGYDNLDAVSGQPDEEVYLYDAVSNRLVCASCNPTGARPVGALDEASTRETQLLVDPVGAWTQLKGTGSHWLAGSIPGWVHSKFEVSEYQPRFLSNSGRLFFDSPDALVPQDTNGLEDVYQYEPAGIGSCTEAGATFSESSGGCVNLISSGQSLGESIFIDASENGDDVFFATNAKLTSEDYDTAYDMYDAHVCTPEEPCRSEPVSPPPCTSGDSCKAAPSPQPETFGPAPSATFSGTGNVVEEPKPKIKAKAKPKKKKAKPKKKAKSKKERRKGAGKAVRSGARGASGKDGR